MTASSTPKADSKGEMFSQGGILDRQQSVLLHCVALSWQQHGKLAPFIYFSLRQTRRLDRVATRSTFQRRLQFL